MGSCGITQLEKGLVVIHVALVGPRHVDSVIFYVNSLKESQKVKKRKENDGFVRPGGANWVFIGRHGLIWLQVRF